MLQASIERGDNMNTLLRKLPTAARLLLGLIFFVFGLNGFLQFLPQPPISGPPADFIGALLASGYLFPLLKLTEIGAGLLLLLGWFVPLALTVLAPVVVNILAFHLFLAPAGLPMALGVLAAELYLAWAYRDAFAGVLAARAEPYRPATAAQHAPIRAAA
jgi:uncharacterized membrane protein YphA (DoxX/SURF4 family)